MIARALGWLLASAATLGGVAAWLPPGPDRLDAAVALLPLAAVLGIASLMVRARGGSALLAALALIAMCGAAAGELRGGQGGGTGAGTLTLITHNVGARNRDPAGTIRTLAASGADLLLLQETDGRVAPLLATLRRTYPYANRCVKRCSLAIFSRLPTNRVRWRFHDANDEPFGPGLIQARIALPGGGAATIVSLHLSRGGTAAERETSRASLAAALAWVGDPAAIVAGDFNLTPWGASARRLDAEMLPLRRATRGLATFPAFWKRHDAPMPLLPIDHVYAGPAWSVAEVRRLPKTGSDHYPVRVKLVWRGAEL